MSPNSLTNQTHCGKCKKKKKRKAKTSLFLRTQTYEGFPFKPPGICQNSFACFVCCREFRVLASQLAQLHFAPNCLWQENVLRQSELCVLTLIRSSFHPRVTAETRKRSRSFCQSAGGRLHLNTHTPLTQRSQSGLTMLPFRHSVGNLTANGLTRNLSGNIRPQSSQPAELLWTDSGINSGIGELISTLKKTSAGRE